MASEDSVEDVCFADAPVLAISVDGVGKPDEAYDAFERLVLAFANQFHSAREELVIGNTRRKAHVPAEEWNHRVPQDAPIRDLQDEHIFVSRLGKDRARPELLRSHFEETSSVPVLIQKELRLDEVAEACGRMSLKRDTDAP